jgi:hypothetical protein
MNTLNERAINYVKSYVLEHFDKNEEYSNSKNKDIYLDKWIDSHFRKFHPFTIDNSNELIEAINYCNERHNNYYAFDSVLVLDHVISEYLLQVVYTHYTELFN